MSTLRIFEKLTELRVDAEERTMNDNLVDYDMVNRLVDSVRVQHRNAFVLDGVVHETETMFLDSFAEDVKRAQTLNLRHDDFVNFIVKLSDIMLDDAENAGDASSCEAYMNGAFLYQEMLERIENM